jgi:hypothetical protein
VPGSYNLDEVGLPGGAAKKSVFRSAAEAAMKAKAGDLMDMIIRGGNALIDKFEARENLGPKQENLGGSQQGQGNQVYIPGKGWLQR